ncbi:MAG TPA: anhydro-N-acetylmuramic acid kinase [Noviherbaspirillum sp.]|nr:anhydro-N-acetylmuramic acid kinase [Noviherbaspirillum sp.]
MSDSRSQLFIGLMSGTSLDGVDGVLAAFPTEGSDTPIRTLAAAYLPFPDALRKELMALQAPGENEIQREALAANKLAEIYAECVHQVLLKSSTARGQVRAIGAHGQTIRHRPELGFTRQTGNPSLLAELTGIDVIADFRSRDIAAGGQGAPLVPAFHQAIFGSEDEVRVVANIGGISNISVLNRGDEVVGFDTGPGNVLLDAWVGRHLNKPFDANGAWGASGHIIPALLTELRDEDFFMLPPPKSTGRDLFHTVWLDRKLAQFVDASPHDIQATLAALTATTLADAIHSHAPTASAAFICGGGAYNTHLMELLQKALTERGHAASVQSTDALGVSPNHVEALAFAWLAHRHAERKPGNLPSVTGAKGARILGCLYPA